MFLFVRRKYFWQALLVPYLISSTFFFQQMNKEIERKIKVIAEPLFCFEIPKGRERSG